MPSSFTRRIPWILLGAMILCLLPVRAAQAQNKNVVLIVADDLGLELGAYGDKVAVTPHLDQLAKEGVRFTQAFCTTSSCSASRSVLLTGLHNHATGMYGLEHDTHHFRAHENLKSLPVLLQQAGYRTGVIGKFHLSPEPVFHFEQKRDANTAGARNAVQMARNAQAFFAEEDPRPFFLYFCTTDPHRSGPGTAFANPGGNRQPYPGVTERPFDPKSIVVPPWLPDRPEIKADLASYYQSVSRFDQGVGALMQALKETGKDKQTLVIFLSDNGPPFPGAKTTLYDPGMKLPLIVRHPAEKSPGRVSEAMISWVDITPTILAYAGVDVPNVPRGAPVATPGEGGAGRPNPAARPGGRSTFHGRSFLPILEGSLKAEQDFTQVFASHTFHEVTMYYPMRVLRTRTHKYILNLAHQLPYPAAQDLYDSLSWRTLLKNPELAIGKRKQSDYIQRPREELYDLAADPNEVNNLAGQPAHAATLEAMRKQLIDWQRQTRDPWLLKHTHE